MIDLSKYRIIDLSSELVPGEFRIDGSYLHGDYSGGRPIEVQECIAYTARMHFIQGQAHAGTHVEAPYKYSDTGTDLGSMPIECYIYVGKLINFLESTGELDNGADGDNLQYAPLDNFIEKYCNNSYNNLGAADSFVSYGAGWAQASTPAFRLYKGFTSEGGIRVPAFVHYPRLRHKGITNSEFLTVKDVMPTLLELAGTQHPGKLYKGREVLPLQGHSILPMLQAGNPTIHRDEQIMGWEMFGYKAIRKGNWKMLSLPPPYGSCDWELFDLRIDPAEQHDLSSEHPAIANDLHKLWVKYKEQNGIVMSEIVASQCSPNEMYEY